MSAPVCFHRAKRLTRLIVALAAALLLAAPCEAALSVRIRADLEGTSPDALKAGLHMERANTGGMLSIAFINEAQEPLASADCVMALTEGELRCNEGNAALRTDSALPALDLTWQARLAPSSGIAQLAVNGTADSGGTVTASGERDPQGWNVAASLSDLPLTTLWPWLPEAVRGHWTGPPGGRINALTMSASDTPEGRVAGMEMQLRDVSLDSKDGNHAAAAAGATLSADWREDVAQALVLRLTLTRGQVYVAPWFRDLSEVGVLTASATVTKEADGWEVAEFAVADPDVLSLLGRGHISLSKWQWPPRQLDIQAYAAASGVAFERFAAPWLIERGIDATLVGGSLSATAKWRNRALVAWTADWPKLDLSVNAPALEINGSRADIGWARQGERSAYLSWQGAKVYRVPLGPASAAAQVAPDALALTAPLRVPVFDGALVLDDFSVNGWSSLPPRVRLAGRIDPIRLPQLTSALGWPALNGELSGMIPGVRYDGDGLTLEGALSIRVFDGLATVTRLRLKDVLGQVPVMEADIGLRNIDLGVLTGAFDIGRIDGRLEGAIDGLRLENWQVAQFDGWVATPVNDDSRRRISQRAVETLSSLGGGTPTAVLSRGFIGLFDSFGYDRLGVRCLLRAGVCEMGGVAPAEQGYYLVRGSGLPRIDVIGYNRYVDWAVLVARLKAAAQSEGPVVQ